MKSTAHVLLVEGRDDQHVISNLARHHNLSDYFCVKNNEGVDKLLKTLPVQIKGSDVKRVGVMLDADISMESRWHALKNLLESVGYTSVPTAPELSGTVIVENGLPHFGAWIMPNNKLSGMLEDFIAFLVPQHDRLYPLAQRTVESIENDARPFANQHVTKAYIHTWLAWQEDPGTPLGLAITKKYLDANASQAISLVEWLKRLFFY